MCQRMREVHSLDMVEIISALSTERELQQKRRINISETSKLVDVGKKTSQQCVPTGL